MRKSALLVGLMALLLVFAMALPSPAQIGAFVYNGTAQLNSGFPCTGSCSGTFSGTARGATVQPTINCATGCAMTATYVYNEPGGQCVAGHAAAPLGTASGTFNFASLHPHFSWTRVGVTAVVLLSGPTGVSVAAFVPPASCAPTNATIAGIAVVV